MSKVTNLNQFRKQKARDAKRAQGDANAAKFGQTKAERLRSQSEAEAARRRLDGHEIDRDDT